MKRKYAAILLAVSMIVSLAGCGTRTVESTQAGQASGDVHMASPEDSLSPEKGDLVSGEEDSAPAEAQPKALYADQILTKDQMLSDYDSMWNAVKESYPFFGVLARQGMREEDYYNTIIEDYRDQIERMTEEGDPAMFEFIRIIAYSLYDVCGAVGHVSILNPNYYRALDVNKRYVDEMPELQAWIDVYDQPQVAAFYEYYDYLLDLTLAQQEAVADSEENEDSQEHEQSQEETGAPEEFINLTMKTMPEYGKVAYIKVRSFDDTLMEHDLPEIRAFLEEVRDYDHLILDIQENGGGNTVYWEEAFVRPNISRSVTYRLLRMMKDTELTRRFYGSSYENSAVSVESLKQDPALIHLPEKDAEDLDLAREITTTLEPEFDEKLFQGKIWVLTGPAVYSSSEAFAVFCKETGFATLVGQTTGGSDSGGAILYELPVSHLLIQFDVEYCLNADGSCNMEMGTAPDVESDHPLETVLELIGK